MRFMTSTADFVTLPPPPPPPPRRRLMFKLINQSKCRRFGVVLADRANGLMESVGALCELTHFVQVPERRRLFINARVVGRFQTEQLASDKPVVTGGWVGGCVGTLAHAGPVRVGQRQAVCDGWVGGAWRVGGRWVRPGSSPAFLSQLCTSTSTNFFASPAAELANQHACGHHSQAMLPAPLTNPSTGPLLQFWQSITGITPLLTWRASCSWARPRCACGRRCRTCGSWRPSSLCRGRSS